MLVDVKEPLYTKVKKLVEKNHFDFPTIQHFVNLAVREKLEKVK